MNKIAKVNKDLEKIEEIEESELSPEEFEKKKDDEIKAERERVAELISGLEDRLAKGEISESTYLMLRKKYEE